VVGGWLLDGRMGVAGRSKTVSNVGFIFIVLGSTLLRAGVPLGVPFATFQTVIAPTCWRRASLFVKIQE
jgi:hypothetical protein